MYMMYKLFEAQGLGNLNAPPLQALLSTYSVNPTTKGKAT
jgi:hypothetical protein